MPVRILSYGKMFVVDDILVPALIGAAIGFAWRFIQSLRGRWGQQCMPESAQVEMSLTDQEMIQKSQDLIRDCFGNEVVERMRNASNAERIAMMSDFSQKLAAMYGLDIDVDVQIWDNINRWGGYHWEKRKAEFNIRVLTVDANDPRFEGWVREVLDTIIHELRHAVQHKAIQEAGFWNVDDQRRQTWANNMANYIKPEVDFKGYVKQPIEADAATFAAQVMSEVH